MTAKSGTIGGFTIGNTSLYNTKPSLTSSSSGVYMGTDGISLGSGSTFKVTNTGALTASNVNITGGNISVTDTGAVSSGKIIATNTEYSNIKSTMFSYGLNAQNGSDMIGLYHANEFMLQNGAGEEIDYGVWGRLGSGGANPQFRVFARSTETIIYPDRIIVNGTTYNSRESKKKNIKIYDKDVIELIKNSEIYEYNYKNEENTDKKHIGFVIGDNGGNYKTPDEIVSKEKDGIESYNVIAILWKAIQEQQKQIEELKEEISKLKGEK